MSAHFDDSAPGEPEVSARAEAFWQSCLRFPSQRPQKGMQCLCDVMGEESWAGADTDFQRAVAVSPGAFTWKRLVRNLVELPALWFKLPLDGRDPAELWAQARDVLAGHAVPLPHFVVSDDRAVAMLWCIEPLRRPKDGKPAFHFHCFNEQLKCWRWAVIKLSFAFESLGAKPLDLDTADALLTGLVPLPLPPDSDLVRHAAELDLELPMLLHVEDDLTPGRIGDVSKPLKRYSARLFQVLGRPEPFKKRRWRESDVSQEARKPKSAGERHPAALKLACGNRWDGLSRDENLADLKVWAAENCERDGAFPARAGASGDELAAIVDWTEENLEPGGPTPRGDLQKVLQQRRRTSRDHVAAAVMGFLSAEGGAFEGTVLELGKRAALWALERGVAQAVPLRTLKRALVDLIDLGELAHDVSRAGATWCSSFSLRQRPAVVVAEAGLRLLPAVDAELENPTIARDGLIGFREGQQRESIWAPSELPVLTVLTIREGPGGAFPLQGGPGGIFPASPPPSGLFLPSSPPTPIEIVFGHAEGAREPLPEFGPVDPMASVPIGAAETDLTSFVSQAAAGEEMEGVQGEAGSATSTAALVPSSRGPRQRRLPLGREREPHRRHRPAREPGVGLPPITDALQNALADVGRGLNDADHKALLEEARMGLWARPRVLDDFAGAVRRRALRILRLRAIAAASAEHVAARKRAEARHALVPPPSYDDRPADVVIANFRQMLDAQVRPLHERSVVERARRLSLDGLSLIPLVPSSKEPALKSWKVHQTERMTLRRLEQELERLGPDAGLAVICGDISQIVVADFDDAAGVAWAKEHLPDTPWKTRTARGEHWYFRMDRGTWTAPPARLPWKGELRANGHYVVAPGSLHPDGMRYEAIGTWGTSVDALPRWSHQWLQSVVDDDVEQETRRLREARARILKGEP